MQQQIRVHVVGCPRSGTTLMTELLRYAYQFGGAAEHERSLFDEVPWQESPYLSKKPADTVRIGKAFAADEDLHVIALIRDPRAVISSVHWSHPEVYFVGYVRWKMYAQTIQSHQNHPRYLVIRYEDLLHDPQAVQATVGRRLPFLVQTRRFEDYPQGIESLHDHSEKALGGVRPFDTSRINSWHDHLGRIRREYEANPQFQNDLEHFGYETGAEWARLLEGVEPTGSSYKDTVDQWPKKWETALRNWRKSRRYIRRRANVVK